MTAASSRGKLHATSVAVHIAHDERQRRSHAIEMQSSSGAGGPRREAREPCSALGQVNYANSLLSLALKAPASGRSTT